MRSVHYQICDCLERERGLFAGTSLLMESAITMQDVVRVVTCNTGGNVRVAALFILVSKCVLLYHWLYCSAVRICWRSCNHCPIIFTWLKCQHTIGKMS